MTFDQQMFKEINKQLYVNGKCDKIDQWVFMSVKIKRKAAAFEAMVTSNGDTLVRRALQKISMNDDGQEVWVYFMFKFNDKKELQGEGFIHSSITLSSNISSNLVTFRASITVAKCFLLYVDRVSLAISDIVPSRIPVILDNSF